MKVPGIPQSAPTLNLTRYSDTTDNSLIKPARRRTRLKRNGAPARQRSRTRPETPLLNWKLTSKNAAPELEEEGEEVVDSGRKPRRKSTKAVSSRKLAAGLWRMQPPQMIAGGQTRSDRLGVKPAVGHVGIPFIFQCNGEAYGSEGNDLFQSPSSRNGANNGVFRKVEPSIPFPNSAMEGATKWDPNPVYINPVNEVHQIYSHTANMKLDQQVNAVSMISALEAELEQARARIEELVTERRTTKKKLEQFVEKVSEEKLAWRSREHEKIRAVITDMKSELNRERKNMKKMEMVNSKLINDRADAKLTAKRYFQEYEKERKARILIEEVCDELAKEIGEDKTEIEEFKRDSMKYRDEVEEERRMLQMAEVWREERVQMKLVDAKVALNEKYSQMNYLVTELENFLRSRNMDSNTGVVKKAELLLEAATEVDVREINGFTYEPPNSNDIFSVFEDLNFSEPNEEIGPCSPEVNMNKNDIKKYYNLYADEDSDMDGDESGWETASHVEGRGSSYSPETPITEISEVYSVSRQKKVPSIPNNDEEYYKIISVDGDMKGRLSSGLLSTKTGNSSPGSGSCSPEKSLKSKLLEARVENQKFQIRHILKQKI